MLQNMQSIRMLRILKLASMTWSLLSHFCSYLRRPDEDGRTPCPHQDLLRQRGVHSHLWHFFSWHVGFLFRSNMYVSWVMLQASAKLEDPAWWSMYTGMHLKACRPLVRWRTQSTSIHSACRPVSWCELMETYGNRPSSSVWRYPRMYCSLRWCHFWESHHVTKKNSSGQLSACNCVPSHDATKADANCPPVQLCPIPPPPSPTRKQTAH